MASMLLHHDQGRGPWILLHVVSGPWTSFVAALDKGQCRKAVCRLHSKSELKADTWFEMAGHGVRATRAGSETLEH
jgi:hypothetical protein